MGAQAHDCTLLWHSLAPRRGVYCDCRPLLWSLTGTQVKHGARNASLMRQCCQCCDAAPNAQIFGVLKAVTLQLEAAIILLCTAKLSNSPLRVWGRSAAPLVRGVSAVAALGYRPFWQHQRELRPKQTTTESFLSSTRRPHHITSPTTADDSLLKRSSHPATDTSPLLLTLHSLVLPIVRNARTPAASREFPVCFPDRHFLTRSPQSLLCASFHLRSF